MKEDSTRLEQWANIASRSLVSIALCSVVLLSSCATKSARRPQLPPEVTINQDAGRGGHLIVMLRLKDGEELPFDVDTGAPITIFANSLKPRLGKRAGTLPIFSYKGKLKADVYRAPKLFLGNVPLVTGEWVATLSDKRLNSIYTHIAPVKGVLGMDCLRHYCIQLDFEARKMRFLNPDHLDTAKLGKAFPLEFRGKDPRFIHPCIEHLNFIGQSTNVEIDTGLNADGCVPEGAFDKNKGALLTQCVWDDDIYSDLIIAAAGKDNTLGLSFLGRHLVTLDFPKRTLYLKQTRVGPLAGDVASEIRSSRHKTIVEAYETLRREGQLPGLSKEDEGMLYLDIQLADSREAVHQTPASSSQLNSVTFSFQKNGDSSIYHYSAARESGRNSWRLEKAWRTDASEHLLGQYPVQ